MSSDEFINKWKNSINHLNRPSVGIHVSWDSIPEDSKVEQLLGKEAWDRTYGFTPPWFKKPKTFQQLTESRDSDYQQIVNEETVNGKIDYYKTNGLKEPYFCAFGNKDGSFVLLGDGNHRFLDCLHLIHEQGVNLDSDIGKMTLDIIYLDNFEDILAIKNIWRDDAITNN